MLSVLGAKIDEESFLLLTVSSSTELIPTLGDRLKFIKQLDALRAKLAKTSTVETAKEPGQFSESSAGVADNSAGTSNPGTSQDANNHRVNLSYTPESNWPQVNKSD